MKTRKTLWTATASAIGMLLLILDSKTALIGAADGIDLCIRTVIPSLFPFFVLSILLTSTLTGRSIRLLGPVARLCGIPEGAEALLAMGLLGGYPVGAQAVYQAYEAKQLTKSDAHRLLGFCSNAGPAFIFGMGAGLFSTQWCCWILWGIHIISAILVGLLLPNKSKASVTSVQEVNLTLPQAVYKAIKVISGVCGWIILFRVVLAISNRWFLWLLPDTLRLALTGGLELANGYAGLSSVTCEGASFLLCACFLSFGGVCVAMQTVSVTGRLGSGLYFPGKILQTAISFLLALVVQGLLFPAHKRLSLSPSVMIPVLAAVCIIVLFVPIMKKTVAFQSKLVYNE